jgi:hypothetical protein
MIELKIIACFFLFIFLIIATFDGLYFHLYKYRLFLHTNSKKEHFLHTLNCLLFPFTILFLFDDHFKGIFLWIGLFLVFATLLVEFFDVFEEKFSRNKLGGLTSLEYALHFAMSGLRATYTSLIVVSKPLEDWSLGSSFSSATLFENKIESLFIYPVFLIGIFVFMIHVYFIFYKEKKFNET